MKTLTLDVETTLNANLDVGLAHPRHPDNKVVLLGTKYSDEITVYIIADDMPFEFKEGVDFIVGHNLGFDLQYLYRNPFGKQYYQKRKLWDTQLAEYLLSGQQKRWASLDELSKAYGLPLKDDKIKEYFEKGIGADKIPLEEMTPYLSQDVRNTEAIAMIQMAKAAELNMLDLILSQMEALHCTIEMMFNGLYVDVGILNKYKLQVADKYADIILLIKTKMKDIKKADPLAYIVEDIASPKQWSTFIFGGETKEKVKVEAGKYKNGNTKYKTEEVTVHQAGRFTGIYPSEFKTKTMVSVDETSLKYVISNTKDTALAVILTGLLKYRSLHKDLNTYCEGMSKHLIGNFIHGNLNHTATVTGRLSSSKPNLQNISNNPIKSIFRSRYINGKLLEFDFSQLEVVGLAHITKDKQLIKDIENGVDIHSELFFDMYGYKPTKEERKPFKSRTFALIYGAGVKTIAEQSGCSEEDAKKFVDTFYTRYPAVKKWHNYFASHIEDSARYPKREDGAGLELARRCVYKTETGRRLVFNEYVSGIAGMSVYKFSPTEMKNYPVQCFATGDIVPLMLGVLFRKLINKSGVKLVNTIHDSIMIDCSDVEVEATIKEVQNVLNNTHHYFEKTFGVPLALKLNAGASVGDNWFEMKEL